MAWDVVSGVQTTSFVVIPGGRIWKNLEEFVLCVDCDNVSLENVHIWEK